MLKIDQKKNIGSVTQCLCYRRPNSTVTFEMFRWSEPKVQVNFWHHLLCGVRLSANELYKAVGHFQPNGTKHSLKKRNISCFNKWQNPIWKEITNNLENRRLVLKKKFSGTTAPLLPIFAKLFLYKYIF